LVFRENNSPPEDSFGSTDVPFDCEFLIARQEHDVISLTEVYRVGIGHPVQTYWFGNYTANGGLTWPKLDFYQRRNNLQGQTLTTAVRAVRATFHIKINLHVLLRKL
jgi:hypothetical protein